MCVYTHTYIHILHTHTYALSHTHTARSYFLMSKTNNHQILVAAQLMEN